MTVGVKAGADFGLTHVSLHYSVNGGPDQTVNILKQPGAKDASGSATLSLEDFKVQPGDVVSLYATAKDNHAETKTDISFIQVDPFEREFSQSQQGGGGGGGGGGGKQAQNQTDISRREKELIAATWKQVNAKGATPEQAAATGKLLCEAQMTLKEQALALSARMQSRDLSSGERGVQQLRQGYGEAAAGMQPAADKLKAMQWQDAMPMEQKVLQALLRAEATFRQIQVAFGQRGGGGGGGGGGGAGRDLASLFDLEMDTQKNQYETAQTGSPAEEQAKKVDDALAKLDALAKRQEELAQQQGNQAADLPAAVAAGDAAARGGAAAARDGADAGAAGAAECGWAAKRTAGAAASGSRDNKGSRRRAGSWAGRASGQSRSGQAGQSQTASRGNPDGNADPRVTQALERLRAANEAMSRAGAQQSAQQSAEAAKSAAQRLREATDLLGGAQKQQASSKLDQLGQQADRLTKEENAEAERVRKLAAEGEAATEARTGRCGRRADARRRCRRRRRSARAWRTTRQEMSDELGQLEKGMRDSARELAGTQPGASGKLRDALSGMDQTDLTNLVQRTADWLREGVNPNSNGTETTIASGLKKLDDQVHQAQQAAGSRGRMGAGRGRIWGRRRRRWTMWIGCGVRLRGWGRVEGRDCSGGRVGSGAGGSAAGAWADKDSRDRGSRGRDSRGSRAWTAGAARAAGTGPGSTGARTARAARAGASKGRGKGSLRGVGRGISRGRAVGLGRMGSSRPAAAVRAMGGRVGRLLRGGCSRVAGVGRARRSTMWIRVGRRIARRGRLRLRRWGRTRRTRSGRLSRGRMS